MFLGNPFLGHIQLFFYNIYPLASSCKSQLLCKTLTVFEEGNDVLVAADKPTTMEESLIQSFYCST